MLTYCYMHDAQVADFIHLDRSRSSYWQAGMNDLLTNVTRLRKR